MTDILKIESSALEPGWRQLAEQVVRTSAFTTCFNISEAALAIVRERRLKPSEAHSVGLAATSRLATDVNDSL